MHFPKLFSIAILTLLSGLATLAHADDTDLFSQPPGSILPAPNVLFVLENSANWSRQAQGWLDSDGNKISQGQAELTAIKNFVAGLALANAKPMNVGLMMMTVNGQNGGYLRYGIRSMSDVNSNNALQKILGDTVSKVQSDEVNESSVSYANALYEAWLYLTGGNSWAGMDANADYPTNSTVLTAKGQGLSSGWAYQTGTAGAPYNTPIVANACAPTYIIFIGNNRQGQGASLPGSIAATPENKLKEFNYTTWPDAPSAWTRFLHLRPDLGLGTAAATNGSVITYVIDVYNGQQNPTFTTILKNMARDGGDNGYFQAGNTIDLQKAFDSIQSKLQPVNSVFASASLPVSVSVRGTYLNQVYLGVFRPDADAKPNWVGNLKQYKLGVDTSVTPPNVFLADSNGAPAENTGTGFVNPGAVSFWTRPSSFWDPQQYANISDSPDGDLVEKGGAAQYVRTTFPTDQSGRQLFTCTGTCSSGSLLSATPFATTNADVMNGLGTTDATEQANIVNWVRGGNTRQDDPLPPDSSTNTSNLIRSFAHGDVLHSRPAVINYNRNGNADDIVVFYGANDGILHAVKGGPGTITIPAPVPDPTGDGQEMWGFIASEHLPQFQRMYKHDPNSTISATNPKPYFMDGSTTTYTHTAADGSVDKAYLFITMRRGGRFIYALDVSDPSNPKFLWKRSNADFPELGQSWSDMKVAKIRAQTNPVLIFGLGYDAAANDPTPQATASMGRGVIVLDALTGTQIWQAGPAPSGSTTLTVPGMTYAIPANVSLFDSNGDGYIDRIYAADTGANVWRFNIDKASPSEWTVSQLAALGGSGPDARKFLYPADIVPATSSNNFDSILIGSGDREHPFDITIQNRFYMIRDDHGLTATRATPIVEGAVDSSTVTAGQLYDATADLVQVGTTAQQAAAATALATGSGWYVRLGSGEKVVSGSTTMAGTTMFGTNSPATASTNSCVGNLGEAHLYMLDYLNAGATLDVNQSGILTLADRYQVRKGGGYPPTPVPVSVRIDGKTYQAAITGTQVITPPGTPLGRRYRTFWQRLID